MYELGGEFGLQWGCAREVSPAIAMFQRRPAACSDLPAGTPRAELAFSRPATCRTRPNAVV